MKRSMVHWTLGGSTALLLFGVGLVAYGEMRPIPETEFKGRLADILPTANELPGWSIRLEDIASTPEMKRAVSDLLNYDDAVYVSYLNGTERVSIYIAHWTAGKMSHRLVASHTPDVCWVGNGWTVSERQSRFVLPAIAGANVQPAERRIMRSKNTEEIVLFWHLVGGRAQSYPNPQLLRFAPATDLLTHGLNQRNEQFFIRISSTKDDGGWETHVAARLLPKLKRAGVPL